jgi:phosphoglycerol transferase
MFGVPIALLGMSTLHLLSTPRVRAPNQKIAFYSCAILINLVLVVATFTASVANSAPSETIERLHMRYYNFALPLLFIMAASYLPTTSALASFRSRVAVASIIIAVALYALVRHLAPYTSNFVDSPELRGFTGNSSAFYVLGGLSVLSLLLWVKTERWGTRLFVYIFMPLMVVYSSYFVNLELRTRINADVYDRAGIFTRQYLAAEELSKLIIVGPAYGFLYRALFHIDNPQVTLIATEPGRIYNPKDIPPGKEWILAIGDDVLPGDVPFQLPMDGFKLAHIGTSDIFDFRSPRWPGVLKSMQGLSQPEPWGTWSSAKDGVVRFEFVAPLPEKCAVRLVAHAFGPNIGKDFVAQAGESTYKFKLGASPEERVFEVSNPKGLRTITIIVPTPVSPKELGLSDEERNLGIGFSKLQIVPIHVGDTR